MNIIITAAGESKRFDAAGHNKPKFLLKINKKTMIENVIDMFNDTDIFHIILNEDHYNKFKKDIKKIKKIKKNINFYFIKFDKEGPVKSILKVSELKKIKGPIIISYCDFLLEWNYQKFKRDAYGYDGAIPCFKDFHPSSFGKTLYAYVKINKKNKILNIQEKKSFTKNRIKEPASVGIYYFKNFEIFKFFSKKLLNKKKKIHKEYYVSLVYNEMINVGLNVIKTSVEKFICLGTPEDLDQYLFWYNVFNNKNINIKNYNQTNLIPLAGAGDRFKIKKYKVRKPFISIQNKPMIVASCESLPQSKNWVFLIRNIDLKKYPIKKKLSSKFNSSIIPVKSKTDGQLSTCYLAKDTILDNKPLFISSGDYQVVFSHKKLNSLINNSAIDGIVWTTNLKGLLYDNPNNFAYCKITNKNIIKKVVEKKTISQSPENDPMVVGCFWFRKKQDFIDAAENSFKKKLTVNNEHYVGNSINYLIKKKKRKFIIFNIKYWISFGNPFELDVYSYWEEFFYKNKNEQYNINYDEKITPN